MPDISTQPQPSSNQPSFNWKGVLVVVVIGAVLIGLGVAIFLLLQPKPEPATTGTTKKATPSAKTSTPSAKKDETADWKTYTDNILKFSIKYPDQIVLIDSKEGSYVKFIRKGDANTINEDDPLSIATVPNLFIRSQGIGGDPEEVFTNSECGKPCDEDIEEITLNNATGIKTLGPRYPYEFNYYLTDSDQSGNVMRLNLVPWDKNPEFKSDEQMTLLKKMVSTFRFHR